MGKLAQFGLCYDEWLRMIGRQSQTGCAADRSWASNNCSCHEKTATAAGHPATTPPRHHLAPARRCLWRVSGPNEQHTSTGRSTVAKEILVHYCTRKVHPTHESFCTALDLHVQFSNKGLEILCRVILHVPVVIEYRYKRFLKYKVCIAIQCRSLA